MELKVVILFFLTIKATYGQDCESGSFYDNLNSNAVSSIDTGYWYLNLDKPCSCSGEVDKYEVKYYDLNEEVYKVHAAMWELNEDGLYYRVSNTKKLEKDNVDKRRKKRAGTSGGESKNVDNVFVRKGAVIGVYFKTNEVAMPIIGNPTSGTHSVCKYQGGKDSSSPMNCTSSIIQTDIIIHAEGQIKRLECNNPDGITNGNFELIDGDKEYGARVQYTCFTGYEIDSGNELLMCDEDEVWTGTVPTCQIVSCVTVNAPLNGIVNMGQGTYTYGDSVSFSCNTGYMIVGNQSITCLADGNWSDSVPTCSIIECEELTAPVNGSKIGSSVTYESTVQFDCDSGYELNGTDSISCQADMTWSDSVPECPPVSCGDPGTPVNGTQIGELFTFNSVIMFTCNEGYYLDGLSGIICLANKSWNTTVPECIQINCGNPGMPTNGSAMGQEYSYQSTIMFQCDDGFELIGSTAITCGDDNQWNSTVPTCDPVSCGAPLVDTDTVIVIPHIYTFPNVIDYQCVSGYELNGNSSAMCQANGEWSVTVPSCDPVSCGDPGSPTNGSVVNDPMYTFQSIIEYKCDDGFDMIGWPFIECTANKQWNDSIPECEHVYCGDPGDISMGSRSVSNWNFTFGSLVSYTCIEGYEIINAANTISCQADGSWSDSVPTCSFISCGEPTAPSNGNYTSSAFTFESIVNYTCNSDYVLIGSSQAVCTKNKVWSTQAPECRRQCPGFSESPSLFITPVKSVYTEGDIVSMSCSSGFSLNGPQSLTCSGTWNTGVPTCIAIPMTTNDISTTTTVSTANGIPFTTHATSSSSSPVILFSTANEPQATSEPEKKSSSNVALLGGIAGGVIFVLVIAIVSAILLLLFVKNQRNKRKYDVKNQSQNQGGFQNPMIYSDVYGTHVAGTNQMEMGSIRPREQRVSKASVVMRDQTHPSRHSPSHNDRVVSTYEVPVGTLVKQDLSAATDHRVSTYELPVGTLVKQDLSAATNQRVSTYEVPVMTLQREQEKTRHLSMISDMLPPPVIVETSFNCDEDGGLDNQIYIENEVDDGTVNQIYMENDVQQLDIYSDLDEAIEGSKAKTSTDATNVLYAEIGDCSVKPQAPMTNTATLEKKGATAKRKTVIFEPPAEETDELYMQLKRQKVHGIRSECIDLGKKLGSGYFGNVYKGEMRDDPDDEDSTEVAIKTLNETATERDKVKFLQEAVIMAQFNHTNVLKLYGVVVTKISCKIVTELMAKGDLIKVLQKLKPDPGQLTNEDMPFILLNYTRQVCLGLSYLSQKGFVHRDIAARNILVDANGTCKVADFGLSRDLEDDNYYMANEGAKVPVKWTAPEALHYRKYSSASDVWSYGCLLYEIWSLGVKPFQNMTNMQSLEKVTEGYRLPPPPGCSREIYNLMILCWHPDNDKRPAFQDLMLTLLMQDKLILLIPEEDLSSHPLAGTIGASLEAGEKMYEKLQMTYT